MHKPVYDPTGIVPHDTNTVCFNHAIRSVNDTNTVLLLMIALNQSGSLESTPAKREKIHKDG